MSLNYSDVGLLILNGNPILGRVLSAELISNLTFEGEQISYTWFLNGIQVNGSTGFSFALDATSVGKRVSVAAKIKTNSENFIEITSEKSLPVWAADPSFGLAFTCNVVFWNAKGNKAISSIFGDSSFSLKIKFPNNEDPQELALDNLSRFPLSSSNFKIITSKESISNISGLSQLMPDVKSAISLTDVLECLKLYLNKPVPNPSPLKFIAADLDGNGLVNLVDVLNLLKIYLGKSTSIPPSWAFTTADYISTNEKFIKATSCEIPDIDVDAVITPEVNLVGVLRGDIDGSWTGTVG